MLKWLLRRRRSRRVRLAYVDSRAYEPVLALQNMVTIHGIDVVSVYHASLGWHALPAPLRIPFGARLEINPATRELRVVR